MPRHKLVGTYQEDAEQAVKDTHAAIFNRDSYYSGELPLGTTWAIVASVNRDSDILEQSNYETIKADLESHYGDEVAEERFNHWAVGWVDYLVVHMLNDVGVVTPVGRAALDWKYKLDDYPVADEEDFSRREYEATVEYLTSEVGPDRAERVFSWLSHHGKETSPDSLHHKDVEAAVAAIVAEDLAKAVPPAVATVLREWIEGQGDDVDDADDLNNAINLFRELQTAYGLSERDAIKLFQYVLENPECAEQQWVVCNLADRRYTDMLVERLGLLPEDTKTLPMFPDLKGLECLDCRGRKGHETCWVRGNTRRRR